MPKILTDETTRQTIELYKLADMLNRMTIEGLQKYIKSLEEELIVMRRIVGN